MTEDLKFTVHTSGIYIERTVVHRPLPEEEMSWVDKIFFLAQCCPCHLRAVGGPFAIRGLLELSFIIGAKKGCRMIKIIKSRMAGIWERGRRRSSNEISKRQSSSLQR